MKTFVRLLTWRPNMKSVSVQVSGSRGLGKSKHYPWSLGRELRPIWHHIYMMCGFLQTNNVLFPMEDSLLTSTNSMMNDNVYYCILSSGLASQKTDNVTNWSISVRKWCVHWAPVSPGSTVSSSLSLTAIICLWWSFWSFVVSKKNIIWKLCRKIFAVARLWLTHHHLIEDSSVCDTELDTEQWPQEEGTVEWRLST